MKEKTSYSKKSNEGTWVTLDAERTIQARSLNERYLEIPIHQLNVFYSISIYFPEFWYTHHDTSDSLRNSLDMLSYICKLLPCVLEKNLNEIIIPQVNKSTKNLKLGTEVQGVYLSAKIHDFDFYLILSHLWGLFHIYSSIHSYIEKICDNYICACRKILNTYRNELPEAHKKYLREMQRLTRKIKIEWNKRKKDSPLVKWRDHHVHHRTLSTIMIDWDNNEKKEFYLSFGRTPWLNESYASIKSIFSLSITLLEDTDLFAHNFCDMALNPKKKYGLEKSDKLNLPIPSGYNESINSGKKTYIIHI